MARSRRELRTNNDMWPGFVDALSTLLLVIIFLLVVFVLAQFVLNQLIQGRDRELVQLQDQLETLGEDLRAEQYLVNRLRRNLDDVAVELETALAERDDFASEFESAQNERLRLADELAAVQGEALRLRRELGERVETAEAAEARAADLEESLAEAREQVSADRETIELQIQELAALRDDIEALRVIRAQLESDIEQQRAALIARDQRLALSQEERAAAEEQLSTAEERSLRAQEEITALNRQLNALRLQVTTMEAALRSRELELDQQAQTIEDLGARLNLALADKVEELSRFRSDFFGRLRGLLGDRDDVRIVGDRFVFQAEVLFPSGSDQLEPGGRDQLEALAATLQDLASEFPQDLPWILQVDGHTDRRPINTPRFPSNWELSAARAISVAQFLIDQGISAERLAAAGFAEFQPLVEGAGPQAWSRNRRIEIKLTSR
ncbi:MAG: peptidoglycan -binding protein [Geminicoccaceae bacterium]